MMPLSNEAVVSQNLLSLVSAPESIVLPRQPSQVPSSHMDFEDAEVNAYDRLVTASRSGAKSPPPPADPPRVEPLTHHTISQDRTASSAFERALLLAADKGGGDDDNDADDKPQFEWVRRRGTRTRKRTKSPSLLMYLAGAKPADDGNPPQAIEQARSASRRPKTETKVYGLGSERSDSSQAQSARGIRQPPLEMPRPTSQTPTSMQREPMLQGGARWRSMVADESGAAPSQSGPGYCNIQNHAEKDLLIQELMRRVQSLQEENAQLLERLENVPGNGTPHPQVQVFHCILDRDEARGASDSDPEDEDGYGGGRNVFLAEPSWERSSRDQMDLRGHSLIPDPESYVRQHPDIAFVICNYYSPEHRPSKFWAALRQNEPLPSPEPARQTIHLVSSDLTAAFQSFLDWNREVNIDFPPLAADKLLSAPYYWRYHYPDLHSDLLDTLTPLQSALLETLIGWIDENYSELYNTVDTHIERRQVSAVSFPFMYRRGQVVVQRSDGNTTSYLLESEASPDFEVSPFEGGRGDSIQQEGKASKIYTWSWTVDSWAYIFDGSIRKKDHRLVISLQSSSAEDPVDISMVQYAPLGMLDDSIRHLLARRGTTFWACRKHKMVSYISDHESSDVAQAQPGRYMVDFQTYKKLHSIKGVLPWNSGSEMPRSVFDKDSPPPGPELFVLPGEVVGFDLRQKKWKDLKVDQIQEVTWNTEAFQHLVASEETKELIQALVTNQLDAEKGTDIIDNKGNGLIMLLHGPPGTGKTFTAESVAEMARKPLYPVTCGDIGTKPEQVEKYLESVFHLGKTWGCVVLLDEAEVFLEQRTLTDLDRNALVSVFLRALEYYDGILILTSNRVGTFDEAFKSRIQLALHYQPLDEAKRRQIWENFFIRLQGMNELQIDFEDINRHLGDLAEYPMNGRQIRNAITTARQLAQFKRKTMTFLHLKHAIEVTGEFDKYLKQLNDGVSDEDFARIDRVR